MRIIAGKYKGRQLRVPKKMDFRPTSERVREAIFSALQSMLELEGLRVLDLYAGSGALGFEALSRGAAEVAFCEIERARLALLRENAEALGVSDQCTVYSGAVRNCLERELDGEPYDLIFADPPYAEHPGEDLLVWLADTAALHANSLLVIEGGKKQTVLEPRVSLSGGSLAAVLEKEKIYGDTLVLYYRILAEG